MYSEINKSEAFLLYCQGISFRRIAEIMSTHPGCESITHSTIKTWSETPDSSGRTWEDRKRDYLVIREEGEKNAVQKINFDIIAETDKMIESITKDINKGNLEFKTKDAAYYALKTIYEFQQKIKDRSKRVAIEEQVRLLIDSMHAIPEVKEVLEKHWKEIYDRFQEKAAALMKEKNRG